MAQYNINTKLNAFLFSRQNFSAALVNMACDAISPLYGRVLKKWLQE